MMTTDASTIGIAHIEEVEHPDTVEIQTLGFWLYLMSDLIIFATLFATFAVLGRNYAGGPTGKELFELPYVLGETLLLLFSSVTYGLVMLAVHDGMKKWVLIGLAVTFLLGLGFVSMEINEFHGLIAEGHGPDRQRLPFELFHPGRDSRYPCDFRADLDGGHDRSGGRQRVDLPRSITADASEYVLAFSGYRLDRHIQYRLPDGSYVNESSSYRQHRRQQGKSPIVPHRFRSFPHSDRHSVCLGDERYLVLLGDPGRHIQCGHRADSGALALLPASGHFIGGALERAGHDIHFIDHGPLRRRNHLDHV